MTLAVAVVVVVICSGICSLVEAALFSVSQIKVKQMAESKRTAAVALLNVRENMRDPIAAIVILTNISNIVGSIVVGAIAADVLGSKWMGWFSGGLTFLIIIFSEIIPKTLGERHSEGISLFCARPILLVAKLLKPLIWIIQFITSPVTKGESSKLTTSEAEIKLLASVGRNTGVLDSNESELIRQSFKLDDLTGRDIMTPRVAMTMLDGNRTLKEATDDIIASQHTRIVIIGENRDDVIGYCRKDQLLRRIIETSGESKLCDLVTEIPRFPDSTTASELFVHFRKSRLPISLALDEFGGVAGVVTLEDVLEILTGEIVDETDHVVDMRESALNSGGQSDDQKPANS